MSTNPSTIYPYVFSAQLKLLDPVTAFEAKMECVETREVEIGNITIDVTRDSPLYISLNTC